MRTRAVILAAGKSVRMHSALTKVLHPLAGRAMIWYGIDAARAASGEKPVVIVGEHNGEAIRQEVGEAAEYALQEPQLGTGHAVQQAEGLLRSQADLVLVITADMPLLTAETLQSLVQAQEANEGPITMLTLIADDPRGFGRVVRDNAGQVKAIVEDAQATPEQRLIRELNASAYCFRSGWLWQNLSRIALSPKGEYYLTDLVEIAVSDGLKVQALVAEDASETIGINNRVHLAEAE
ncbi:MAG TPA: NTP transferase domain-containing protein, partial [Anaerolineales bacterium]